MGVKDFGSSNYRKLDMGRHTLEGNPPIAVTIRHSARAKRISLRVSRLDGKVTLTLPHHTPDREGIAFLEEKAQWLRGHVQQVAAPVLVAAGVSVPVLGIMHRVEAASVAKPSIADGRIVVPSQRPVGATVKAVLRTKARDALDAAVTRHARDIGRPCAAISLRDTRSRWGSCTATGKIMLSWRLIMAPAEVLDYVAAHEVAHLIEMNHSARFWRLTAQLCPDFQRHRDWLRLNGDQLHRYQFVH